MSTNTLSEENSSDTTDEQRRRRQEYLAQIAGTFAVDATGAKHRYSRARDTIYVTRDGELEHVEELNGRDVDDWISYVRFNRGLVDEWFHETLGPVEGARRMQQAVEDAADTGDSA